MKTIAIEIRGNSPLLIHRFAEREEQAPRTRQTQLQDVDPREEATRNAYIAPDGTFYFNAFAILGAMTTVGANYKQTGTRKTLRFVVPSAVRLETDTITIMNGTGPADHFEVDSRPVTIPATKGRIMRHRPRFNDWGAKFNLRVDDRLIGVDMVQRLLVDAGEQVGVGDFRPEKRGPFGTFRVTRFEEAA